MRERLIALFRKLVGLLSPELPGARDRVRFWRRLVNGAVIFGVCVAVLMALTAVPWWLELPALAVLWFYGVMCFMVYGTAGIAFLWWPFYLLWTWIRPEDEEAKAKREAREQVPVLSKWKMIKLGIATESDFEKPEHKNRSASLELGWMSLCLRAIAGVALVAAGHPVLAFVYLFPVITMFALDVMVWAREALLVR